MKRLLAAGLALAASALALAQSPDPQMPQMSRDQYLAFEHEMCMKSADAPTPYGEGDLKGNAKFGAYCDCFSGKFGDRAYKLSQGTLPKPTLKENLATERGMRNECRAQLGLPQIEFRK